MTTRIDFESTKGERIHGELGEPAGTGKAPALIVVQEWWGVNDHIRSLVDRFAAAGFLTLAPDLYHGKTTKDGDEAATLMKALDWPKAIHEVAATLAYLRKHPRSNGNVGITGFCLGGAVALTAGAQLSELRAVVPFYGIGDPKTDFAKMTAAVMGHFGEHDDYIKADAARALGVHLESQGKSAEIHLYDAGHAFVNDTRPEAYDASSAKLAWDRSLAFLHEKLDRS